MSRWTDIATWIGPTVNSGDGDSIPGEPADAMTAHRGLVVHIAEGTYEGTISWEKNPSADVSSHFVTARDGRCAQMVDTTDRSWCQIAGNRQWLSVENEGYPSSPLTPQQCELLAQLLARCHTEYGVPLQIATSPDGYGLGTHAMGGDAWGGHYQCPGPLIVPQLPGIIIRAQQIIGGTMSAAQAYNAANLAACLMSMIDPAAEMAEDGTVTTRENKLAQTLLAIQAAVSAPQPVALTDADRAAIAAEVADAVAIQLTVLSSRISTLLTALASAGGALVTLGD